MTTLRGVKIALMAIQQNQKKTVAVISTNSEGSSNIENSNNQVDHPEILTVIDKPANNDEDTSQAEVTTLMTYSDLVSSAYYNESTPGTSREPLETIDIEKLPILFLENENTEKSVNALLLNPPPTYIFQEVENCGGHENTSSQVRLVDYASSSESEAPEMNVHRKNKKFKRFDSDLSFHENKDSDSFLSSSDSEGNFEKCTGTVGESGLRKPKKNNKKEIRKIEELLGATKSVQENPCKNKVCQNGCAKNFTEQQRHSIFEFYWGLSSHQRQRDWLLSCMKEIDIKRRRTNNSDSRRNRTFKYFISWEGKEAKVCQQFLLKTLCISQMTLRYTKNNAVTEHFGKTDQRGKHDPPHKTKPEDKKCVQEFIKKLPAVPSHYCRASTTKKYLPSEMRNVSFLYRIFVKDQLELHNTKTRVSLKVFRNIFNRDFNLGFHLPKKDKCIVCESRKDGGIKFTKAEIENYENHVKDKEESKKLFISDQKIAKEDGTFVCASFDLQKVLNTPHGDNMLLYYSRKYSMYNETVYESGTRNSFCYLWGEVDGNRGANEICTVIKMYLENVDQRNSFKTVCLYCDSCSGQNKNRAMLAMLHTFLKKSKNVHHIKIVFLLPGHTYMPVDAVHATIERFVSKRIVWAPSEWATLVANARVHPRAFEVIPLKHFNFEDWKATAEGLIPTNLKKTKEGRQFQISQLRVAYLQKGEDDIKIKYSYSDSADEFILPIFGGPLSKGRRTKKVSKTVNTLYPSPLEISAMKVKNLVELCEKRVIPQRYWEEYKAFVGGNDVPDTLAETDEEDDKNEES